MDQATIERLKKHLPVMARMRLLIPGDDSVHVYPAEVADPDRRADGSSLAPGGHDIVVIAGDDSKRRDAIVLLLQQAPALLAAATRLEAATIALRELRDEVPKEKVAAVRERLRGKLTFAEFVALGFDR